MNTNTPSPNYALSAPSEWRPLGRSDIRVGPIGLGGAPMGGRFGPVEPGTVIDLIDGLVELGLNLVDTAAKYGSGTGEKMVGAALDGHRRDQYVLSTKVAVPPGELNRAAKLRRAISESRRRLGCDDLDLVLLHDPDDLSPSEVAQDMATLQRERDAGGIRATGAGGGRVGRLRQIVTDLGADAILLSGRYTLLDQSAARSLLPACEAAGVGVVLGSVFNSGILATGPVEGARFVYRPAPPQIAAKVRRLDQIGRDHRVRLPDAAVAFGLAHPAVASVLIGTTQPAHLRAAASGTTASIPSSYWDDLRSAGLLASSLPTPS